MTKLGVLIIGEFKSCITCYSGFCVTFIDTRLVCKYMCIASNALKKHMYYCTIPGWVDTGPMCDCIVMGSNSYNSHETIKPCSLVVVHMVLHNHPTHAVWLALLDMAHSKERSIQLKKNMSTPVGMQDNRSLLVTTQGLL